MLLLLLLLLLSASAPAPVDSVRKTQLHVGCAVWVVLLAVSRPALRTGAVSTYGRLPGLGQSLLGYTCQPDCCDLRCVTTTSDRPVFE